METIANAAGVAVGTLYNHFEDRNALLGALLRARAKQLTVGLDEALARTAKQPFVDQLRAVVEVAQQLLYSDGCMRILMDAEGLHVAKTVFQPTAFIRSLHTRIDHLVERGVAAGVVRPNDSQFFSWFILSGIRALTVRRLRDQATESLAEQREALVRFLMQGLGA